jgi:hypothetical protein
VVSSRAVLLASRLLSPLFMSEPGNPEDHSLICTSCGREIDPELGLYHSSDLLESYHPACYDRLNTVSTMVILTGRPPDEDLSWSDRRHHIDQHGVPRPLGQPPPVLPRCRPAKTADPASDVEHEDIREP